MTRKFWHTIGLIASCVWILNLRVNAQILEVFEPESDQEYYVNEREYYNFDSSLLGVYSSDDLKDEVAPVNNYRYSDPYDWAYVSNPYYPEPFLSYPLYPWNEL